MPYHRYAGLTAVLLAVLLFTGPAAGQETREFSGTFWAQVLDYSYEEPLFYVTFDGGGESDLFGAFGIPGGQYVFDVSTFEIPEGYLTISTPKGDLWAFFTGSCVFTGRLEYATMYFYGGTGAYENAWGVAEVAAQFWQRSFIEGDATFTFVGEITY